MSWVVWFFLLYFATWWLVIPGVLLSTKRPASMVAWIGAVILLPFAGAAFYFAFGTERLRRRRLERHRRKARSGANPDRGPKLAGADDGLVQTFARITRTPPTGIKELTVLADAPAYYDALLAQVGEAKHHIHFQTYVWREDDTGRRFRDELCAAARRGVAVRVLVDELGSFETPEEFFQPLIDAGGEFSWFYTIHPRRNRYFLNLRNHRKLQIVDGRIAFVGGMNIGREYEGGDPAIGPWHDLQVSVTGAVVNDLQEIFANDWSFATQKEFSGDDYFPGSKEASGLPAVLVESGPDMARKPFLQAAIALCNHAEQTLDLFTPYFVPVPALIGAMQLAAARGVRVRLMISEKNDHRFLVKIGRSYYEELMDYGVGIYEYSDAVHHAKAIIADSRWLMVGSANLDVRSIDLNFELNFLVRSEAACAELDRTYSKMFDACAQLDLETFRRRSRRERLAEGLSRLWAPLL